VSAAAHGCAAPPRAALSAIAGLLEYPAGDGVLARAVRCRAQLAETAPEAAAELAPFVVWLANASVETLEEIYTRMFYVSPVCVPYVGVHLFGEEGFQRGALMARLLEAFDARGFDAGDELPDHVAVLLRFAELLDPEELDDLVEYCLRGPVDRMAARLATTTNPYRHALGALHRLVQSRGAEGAPS
jgi:nitrate reductase delta subunit